ncbi:MAG: 2,3-bisphosphoglycerate-independent phosphoglycerate mutase [Methylophilaceae bacterium]|jgi:2,3-bisphosphoglycerate-independent phosphoglycerate mutase|nr:2,3-bisphosphoglycerate-independent phosphoglycerate mutase [Methylophilaceae bacterium]
MKPTPVILLILDGFGYREEAADNAIALARKPNWDNLWATYPHTLINASEHYVGLPDGQMGNSEVGHLNIGAGRVVYQDFERINQSIQSGEFFRLPVLVDAIDRLKASGKALHIFGLLSDGGVHSHQDHIHAMLEMAVKRGLKKVYVHAFLDGRDTPPVSAGPYIEKLEAHIAALGAGKIASICGRFYAMDRDKRWPRVEAAYDLITEGISEYRAASASEGLQAAYARDEHDEFVKPTAIAAAGQAPVHLEDGDIVVQMNFRSDRARQLTHALLAAEFDGFHRRHVRKLAGYFTLTLHDKKEAAAVPIFPPFEVRNTFGEYVAGLGMKQLRIAETEKYPHVTFFFNGGEELVFEGEDRILVPSPQVATYDLQPEMSAHEVTDRLEEAILSKQYQAIICNYANCDMVGHSGILQAAIKAVEAVDISIGRIVAAAQKTGAEVIITADHGNVEMMLDKVNHQPHTQHTTNLVPLIYIGRQARLAETGALSDIAPTLLKMMGLAQPAEMTGKSLVEFDA